MDKSLKQALLLLARQSMRAHLAGVALPALPSLSFDHEEFGGAFVSLHNNGRLRGCIGRFECGGGVPRALQRIATAVLADPRFVSRPVTLDELEKLAIEISLLSPMQRMPDPLNELDLSLHGIFIRSGIRAGCFLPRVALKMGWNAQQLLNRCCAEKAGLAADAWKDPLTEVYFFTAEVFEDHPPTSKSCRAYPHER